MGRPVLPEGLLTLSDVTVRLGINSYKYKKLKEILGRYPEEIAVAETRAIIMQNFETQLEMGRSEGGNCVISWDPEIRGHRGWTPSA